MIRAPETPPSERQQRTRASAALWLFVPAPALGAVLAMWLPATMGTPLGQGGFAFIKLWIILLPLVWLKWVDRGRFSLSPPRSGGWGMGIGSGLLIGAAILAVFALTGSAWIEAAGLQAQMAANGITTPGRYLALCAYMALANALIEEYAWRWFVFSKCEILWGAKWGSLAAAIFFTLHHILVLAAEVSWPVTVLGSLGVFSGGLIWTWCYRRYRSIWPGYVSHLLADCAIFLVGWFLLF